MSWKETDPLALWRTHSTLPVPESMLTPPREPNENFANQIGTARKNIWSSLNEMNSEQRQMFFSRVLHVWPYPLERHAIKLPQSAFVFSNVFCAGYIAVKISADVFFVDPKISWLKALRAMPTLSPNLAVTFGAFISSNMLFQRFVYMPFIQHEGLLSSKNLFWRSAGIAFMTGTAVPCMFAPVAAHFHNTRILQAAGKPPIPANSTLDLLVICWESTRSVWRRLPLIVAINFCTAVLTAAAMTWGRERLHNTMSLDAEFIRTLMDGSEKAFQEKSSVKMMKTMRNLWSKFDRFDKEIFLPPPMSSKDGPKWRDKGTEDEAQLSVGFSVPLRSWKAKGQEDDE